MKSSSNERDQISRPLGKAASEKPSAQDWRPYGPNPNLEINAQGKLRTKPGSEHAPLKKGNPWEPPYI